MIPELRFPEFVKERLWKDKMLGDDDVSRILRGGSPRPITEYLTNSNEGLNWLKIGDVDKQSKYVLSTEDKVHPSALPKTREVLPGDLIMSNSMSFGRPYILKIQTCIHDGWIAVTEINEKIDTDFLYYLILSDRSQRYFVDSAAGGGIKNLNAEIIKKLPIAVPPILDEQQKIAVCLSSLDNLIEAHNQKLDALKDHKKGLMQNLFPQNDEKVPRLRFPEFVNDGEWKKKQLIDTADTNTKWSFTGGPFGSNLKANDYTIEGFRIIQLQNIGDGEFNDESKIFTSKEKADELLSCNIYAGDIIISKMGDPVGRACIIPDNLTRCVMASDGIRLVVDENNYSKYFIYTLINSTNIRESIERKSTGSTRKRIGLDVLRSIVLLLPKKCKEQEKIAACFQALDESIKAESQKIEKLKVHKKGLMQGLFVNVK